MNLVPIVRTLPTPAGGAHPSIQKAIDEVERLAQSSPREERQDVASEYLATGELDPVLKFLSASAPDTKEAAGVSRKIASEINAMEKQKASCLGNPGHTSLFHLKLAHIALRVAIGTDTVTVLSELESLAKSLPQPTAHRAEEAAWAYQEARAAASEAERAYHSAQAKHLSAVSRSKACPSDPYAAEDVEIAAQAVATASRAAQEAQEAADAARVIARASEAAEGAACYREAVAQAVKVVNPAGAIARADQAEAVERVAQARAEAVERATQAEAAARVAQAEAVERVAQAEAAAKAARAEAAARVAVARAEAARAARAVKVAEAAARAAKVAPRAAETVEAAPRDPAARCLLQIAQAAPETAQPHPLTKELLAAAEIGRSDAAALRMKATGVLQGLDRCLYKIHPGRTGLQLAAWAVSATLSKVDKDALVIRAVQYAHAQGIDVTGPLVEYILRRKC